MPLPATIKIEVSQDDIDLALRENQNACAVFNAIARQYPTMTRISVNDNLIRLSDPQQRVRFTWDTPDSVVEWIQQFDRFEPVRPFTFTLSRAKAERKPFRERTVRDRQQQIRYELDRQKQLANETPEEKRARLRKADKRRVESRRGRRVA